MPTKGVFGISKIQIQKQITTAKIGSSGDGAVYLVFQRYKFKSKSQQQNVFPEAP